MASDVLHHQHTARGPASAAVSGIAQFNNGRPIVINFDSADDDVANLAGGNTNSVPAAPAPVPAALPSMRSLLMSCEGSLPFILIILAKLLYDHRLGMHSTYFEVFYAINLD